jgi:hypothetical protein
MVVTTSNVYTESRNILKTLITSNVVDPKTGSINSRRRWIYREFPDTTSGNFQGYPIIVLKSADVNNEFLTLSGDFRDNIMSFEIEVYVEFNDTNARVDSISDQILNAIMSNQDSLADDNMFNPDIDSSPFTSADEDGKQLSARLMRVDFSLEGCW